MTPIRVSFLFLAEDMGLEPTGLLHLTAFPMRLLSHSVNPPSTIIIYHKLRKIASSFCYVFKTFFCSRFLVQNKTFTLRIILYLSLFHRATDCKYLCYCLSGSVLHTKKAAQPYLLPRIFRWPHQGLSRRVLQELSPAKKSLKRILLTLTLFTHIFIFFPIYLLTK